MPVEFKHIEMVGRLAKDEEIKGFEDYGRTAVFINKPGDIQYKIKSLSTKNDVSEEQFTGYINSIRNLEFVDGELCIKSTQLFNKKRDFLSLMIVND